MGCILAGEKETEMLHDPTFVAVMGTAKLERLRRQFPRRRRVADAPARRRDSRVVAEAEAVLAASS